MKAGPQLVALLVDSDGVGGGIDGQIPVAAAFRARLVKNPGQGLVDTASSKVP
jgi:hypothetical protein